MSHSSENDPACPKCGETKWASASDGLGNVASVAAACVDCGYLTTSVVVIGAENVRPKIMIWHDEADRLAAWGALDPLDACMCRECILPPGAPASPEPPRVEGSGA